MRTWLGQRWRRGSTGRRVQARPGCDPLDTLWLQLALARLEREIQMLQRCDDHRFARAHHFYAALSAYDGLLAQACVMAGVSLPSSSDTASWRLIADAELRLRGWSW